MRGKTVVITGATSGIGLEAAKEIAALGAKVVVVGRNDEKAEKARAAVVEASGNGDVHIASGDLGTAAGVRHAIDGILTATDRIDVLANNAGLYVPRFRETDEGIETTFAVNHLGYHRVTMALLPRLRATVDEVGEARVVSTASAAHLSAALDLDDPEMREGHFRGWTQYANTKLMNILWTRRLAKELDGSGVTANCFHPGFVRTHLAHRVPALGAGFMLFGTSVQKGADTLVWLASSDEMAGESGGYYAKRRPGRMSSVARDDAEAERLWSITTEMVNAT